MLNVVSRISGGCKWTSESLVSVSVWKSRLGAGKDASPGTMDYPDRLMEAASIFQCMCVYQSSLQAGIV